MGGIKIKSHIAIDTMILIYLLEKNLKYLESAKELFKKADHITLSTLGFGEVIAGFEKRNNKDGKLKFFSFLESQDKIKIINFNKSTALIFAQLRAKYPSIKPPDVIHLATAISSGADYFLTNDKNLKQVEEIEVRLLSK